MKEIIIREVRINHLKNAMGTGKKISVSWKLDGTGRNIRQRAYRLRLAAEGEQSWFYESGWVESEKSVAVRLPVEELLESCTKYIVEVQVQAESRNVAETGVGVEAKPQNVTETGAGVEAKSRKAAEADGERKESEWATATFVTGILKKEEWQASFITGETPEEKDKSGSTQLEKEIFLAEEVKQAYACTTALGLYHFYCNGEKAGEDELTPGWTSYQKHLCYQTYDVSKLLKKGKNTVSALVGAGWYKGKMGFLHLRNNYGERAAFLMQLTVVYESGRKEVFVTDTTWQGAEGPVVFSEIYDGEIYDASKEEPVWNREVESIDFPCESLTPQPGCRVKVMEKIPAQRIFTTPKGERVIDFGQNLTGWIETKTDGKPGEELHLRCFETLDAEGNVYTANLRTAKQEIRYLCNGKKAVYHPNFTFQGFRYAVIDSFPGGEPKKENFTALVLYSEMEHTGEFSCSEPLVNQLQHNILWGMKGNFVDIPTDCPQRDERMGWTGDAQIFCRTACFLMNTYAFFEKWLQDVAADQTPEGGVPHVVPDIISGKESSDWLLSQGTHSAAAWADVAVINPWTMYLVYGDTQILEEQYESMKKWIDFMKNHAVDYIWNYRLQFGDWVALDAEEGSYLGATPNDLTCTAYFAFSTGLFVKICEILGKEQEAEEYRALYQKIREKFQKTFFTAEGDMTAQTQTAHILALHFELVPEKFREKTARRLTELLAERGGHLVTGFVGTPYFCHALSQNGYVDEAYDLLLREDFPSWLYQVKQGATTVWEHWDGLKPDGSMWSPDMNSFNHYAYGAVGDWLYRVVLGMETDERKSGYALSKISPRTGKRLEWAKGSYESAYGKLAVEWKRERTAGQGDRIVLLLTVPANTTARIYLEPEAEEPVAAGLAFQKRDGSFTAEAGSGIWEITYYKQE